jgi:hypothetical protein
MSFIQGMEIIGLDKVQGQFNKFNFRVPNIRSRFLDMIGVEALELLRMNTPVDTGQLRDSWVLRQSANEVVIFNEQPDLLSWHLLGSKNHKNPRNFVAEINQQVDNMVMKRLELALAENHKWFKDLPGGKGRRFQQVGRTSAGFRGGTSFAGRATLVRPGTGRRQLKRRLSLRRRRGASINPAKKDIRLG